MADNPTRIAVLGGGLGAMAAAYALSATSQLRQRYDITVYQVGWRLGGKGASGRNLEIGSRIEEHGLHMWLGFYQNAFRVMRECYAAWARKPFDVAFTPQYQLSFGEWLGDGEGDWSVWNIHVPKLPGTPGSHEQPSIVELVVFALKWLLDSWLDGGFDRTHPHAHRALKRAHRHASSLDNDPAAHAATDHARLLTHLEETRSHIDHNASNVKSDLELSHRMLLIDLGVAIVSGFIKDILPHGEAGYHRIDDIEFRTWLRGHGASNAAIWSAPIRALYTVGFAAQNGDAQNPRAAAMAAGVTVKVLLHAILGSRGAPLWRMHAGMGDTVFSPFYEVLKERGVKFEFFSQVKGLDVTPSGSLIKKIKIDQQVAFTDPDEPYEPLVTVKDWPCWPSEPDWEKIVDGKKIAGELADLGLTLESPSCAQSVSSYTLELGRDFDQVVLGISLGALPEITPALSAVSKPWQLMLDNIKTTGTMALQLWVNEKDAGLGWTDGATVLTSFAEPLDSWADMTHLIDAENWPASAAVKGIHYFCGALDQNRFSWLPSGPPQKMATEHVYGEALSWLGDEVKFIWPKAVNAEGFRWDLLVDLSDAAGSNRLDGQYYRANVEGSELYVLSTPGSIRYRLPPGDSDFSNLFLAGDWTAGTFEAGCVEAAVESGLEAAKAVIKTGQ